MVWPSWANDVMWAVGFILFVISFIVLLNLLTGTPLVQLDSEGMEVDGPVYDLEFIKLQNERYKRNKYWIEVFGILCAGGIGILLIQSIGLCFE